MTQNEQKWADLLAQTFYEDPWMQHVFPNPKRRVNQATRLYTCCVRYARRHGRVVESEGAVLLWLPSQSVHVSWLDIVRTGMVSFPLSLGIGAWRRLSRHEDEAEKRVVPLAGDDAAYLWIVGVEAALRGGGKGTQIVEKALHR